MLAGEGGVGVKNLVMRGEGEGRGGGRTGGGSGGEDWSKGGWEVEHVPDRERPFGGRGFWLRWVRGVPF